MWAVGRKADVVISGPGFSGWDVTKSGVWNVENLGCHVVWGYKLGGCELGPLLNDVEEVSKKYLTVESYNECWPGTEDGFKAEMHPGGGAVSQECAKAKTGLVICHHENDLERVDVSYGGRKVHIPHCADPNIFTGEGSKQRNYILTGVCGHDHYPVRHRWWKIISRMADATYFRRPPNRVDSIERAEQHVQDYAHVLATSSVKLGCASRWKYPLGHFVESAMSGTIQVASMPDPIPPGFEKFVIPVAPHYGEQEMIEAASYALSNAEELGQEARLEALKRYTTDHYADMFLKAVSGVL